MYVNVSNTAGSISTMSETTASQTSLCLKTQTLSSDMSRAEPSGIYFFFKIFRNFNMSMIIENSNNNVFQCSMSVQTLQ